MDPMLTGVLQTLGAFVIAMGPGAVYLLIDKADMLPAPVRAALEAAASAPTRTEQANMTVAALQSAPPSTFDWVRLLQAQVDNLRRFCERTVTMQAVKHTPMSTAKADKLRNAVDEIERAVGDCQFTTAEARMAEVQSYLGSYWDADAQVLAERLEAVIAERATSSQGPLTVERVAELRAGVDKVYSLVRAGDWQESTLQFEPVFRDIDGESLSPWIPGA